MRPLDASITEQTSGQRISSIHTCTSSCCKIVAPSFVIVTSPKSSTSILSSPRGPSDVWFANDIACLSASRTQQHRQLTRCPPPCPNPAVAYLDNVSNRTRCRDILRAHILTRSLLAPEARRGARGGWRVSIAAAEQQRAPSQVADAPDLKAGRLRHSCCRVEVLRGALYL